MNIKYILIGVAAVVAFILMDPARIRWLIKAFKKKSPEKLVPFAGSVRLKWSGHFWEGKTILRSWAGFQERLGPYAFQSSSEPSRGEVQLSISSPDEKIPVPPSEAQNMAFSYIQQNDQRIQAKVVKAMFDAYPEWRATYREFLGEDFERQMPVLGVPLDLKSLIGLSTIHILSVEKDGLAYTGFEFGCTWEEEHGLGVMLHRDEIIDVGAAEEAFSTGTAKEHASKGLQNHCSD